MGGWGWQRDPFRLGMSQAQKGGATKRATLMADIGKQLKYFQ